MCKGSRVNNPLQSTILAWESLWLVISESTRGGTSRFYHIHRLGHLPTVYEHAHRAGFPEEFFFLLLDILMLRSGVPVPCMTYRLLKHQLANKDAHQRREGPYEEEQYHQDHHLHHRANYGFNRPMLDMIFNTYKRTEKEWLDVNHARPGRVTARHRTLATRPRSSSAVGRS
ncbi:unnamed protein product [Durusdinium trenchii]|uniref:Uncharacterized protein n=1 Tax=Durusdinium trenchii TaxID=1381693 RepID=A0ABP0P593_9DINO